MGEPSTPRTLILASTSPRRKDLLREAGFAFEITPPDVREVLLPGETPEQSVRRLAEEKARSVLAHAAKDQCVLAADTVVVLGDEVLGKPCDAAEARAMLLRLADETHRVLTGFALACATDCIVDCVESLVRMRRVSDAEATAYARGPEPLDKAGGYALQGEGARFVERVTGSRSNVIGLPLEAIVPRLEGLGVRRSCPT